LSYIYAPARIGPLGDIAIPQTMLVCLVKVAIAAKWFKKSGWYIAIADPHSIKIIVA